MATFQYKAISETGTTVSGTLEADSPAGANAILVARGLMPSEVIPTAQLRQDSLLNRLTALTETVKTRDLILFTKQLRSMLNAGVPIIRLMQVLEAQTESTVLRKAIAGIIADIRQGATITDAFEKYPKIFPPLYCSMLRAGEASGSVPAVLERVIYIIEHEEKIKSDIKAAMQYPLIVVIALGIAFIVLLTFVIPQFVMLFSKTGLDLPLPTKIAIALNIYLTKYWYILIGMVVAVVVALGQYFKTHGGKVVRDSLLLRVPVLGALFQKAAMSRFSSIFAILHSSGVPVMQSLTILSDTIGNAAIARSFDHVRDRIQEGSGIAGPLKSAPYFPPMVVDMVAIGEESGNIEEMLREISKHYDDEVEYAVKALSDAIGPILIVGLAAVVGFFALAIFLPMWDLTKIATQH